MLRRRVHRGKSCGTSHHHEIGHRLGRIRLAQQRAYLLRDVLPNYEVKIATFDNEIVGFVAASPESIAQLYVRGDFQRRGVGTQLLSWAKQHSSGSLWLYTFARNVGARAFYERRGFTATAYGFEPNWRLDDVKYEWVGERRPG